MISRVPVHSGTWVAITELDTEEVARSFFLGGGGRWLVGFWGGSCACPSQVSRQNVGFAKPLNLELYIMWDFQDKSPCRYYGIWYTWA